MHPKFKQSCQQKIIKSCIFVLHLQSLQKSILWFKGKGLLGRGFCEFRGLILAHVNTNMILKKKCDTTLNTRNQLLHTLATYIIPHHCIQKLKD